ncbi:MAG: CRISPR system precrRNA processing endoribonuclease RAMP protein Cas6 [Candidatus Hydrothermarchaeota archaeon]
MLRNFRFQKFRFFLRPLEDIELSSFKGATLRGGFGSAFRRIVCLKRDLPGCQACPLKKVCVYSFIFETSPSENSTKLRKMKDIPRPFIIEPPLDGRNIFSGEDYLSFNLILIGRAIDYLPYFIFTFEELGKRGLGKGRGKYEFDRVEVSRPESQDKAEIIYSGKDKIICDSFEPIKIEKILTQSSSINSNIISLKFLTPTRIKFNNKLLGSPEFHHLIRALLHRISALSYFHCGQELEVDFKRIIEKAGEVEKVSSELTWSEFERYSTRQKTRMKMGGFIGKVTYRGDVSEFLPFLLLGEQIHIGKSCTFGFGKYIVNAD